MGRERVVTSHYTRDALTLLGSQIKMERTAQRYTQARLAMRAQCSERSVRMAEQGSPSVSIGIVFNICAVLRMRLFGADPAELAVRATDARRINAIVPQRVILPEVDNDF